MDDYLPIVALYGAIVLVEIFIAYVFLRMNHLEMRLMKPAAYSSIACAALIFMLITPLAAAAPSISLRIAILWAFTMVLQALLLHFLDRKRMALQDAVALASFMKLASFVLVLVFFYQNLP